MAFQSSMNTYYVWIHTLYLQGMDSYLKKKLESDIFFNMSIISLDFWI